MPNGKANKSKKSSAGSKGNSNGKKVVPAKSSKKKSKAGRTLRETEALATTAGAIGRAVESVVVEQEVERAKAVELAKKLCCPNMYPPFGVQDGYSSFPTGVSSPYMVEPASFSTVDQSVADALNIPSSESWAFAYRDPRCSLRFYDGNDRTFDYVALADAGVATFNAAAAQALNIDYLAYNTGFEAHGPIMYAGEVESGPASGTRFFLGSYVQSLVVSGLPNSTVTEINVDVLVGDEVTTFIGTATSSAGGVATFPFNTMADNDGVSISAYQRHFMWGNVKLGQIMSDGQLLLSQSADPVLRQFALADWSDVETVIEKIRFPALNLMYSNTAAPLNRSGFATAWQVPSNIDPLWLMGQGFQYLANRPNAERMEAVEGIHIFWKSSDPVDWEYLEVGDADGATSPSSYIISSDSDYLAISLDLPDVTGRAGYWTVFSDTQYRHDSVWFPTMFPDHTRRTFELALELQSRVPQVHSNPFHIKDIFKWIGAHKNQLQSTADMADRASGNRLGQFTTPFKDFLNIWFK